MAARKGRKKEETSKLILYISDAMSGLTLVLTFVAVFAMQDASPLAYLIPAVFGLSSVAHGFYYWKAKAENMKKFGQAADIKEDPDGGYSGSGEDPGSFG